MSTLREMDIHRIPEDPFDFATTDEFLRLAGAIYP